LACKPASLIWAFTPTSLAAWTATTTSPDSWSATVGQFGGRFNSSLVGFLVHVDSRAPFDRSWRLMLDAEFVTLRTG
jgi:hypothetical protein